MVDERRVQRWAVRLSEEIPGAVAVFLVGSRLTGDAGPHSDLDFDVLVERAPQAGAPSWFDSENGGLLRVSAWIRELAAQDLARSCPSLLAPMNPHPPVASRRAAPRTALAFEVVPPGYQEDLLACLGLASRPATSSEVHAAACRLANGVTEVLISKRPPTCRCCPRISRRRWLTAACADTSANR